MRSPGLMRKASFQLVIAVVAACALVRMLSAQGAGGEAPPAYLNPSLPVEQRRLTWYTA